MYDLDYETWIQGLVSGSACGKFDGWATGHVETGMESIEYTGAPFATLGSSGIQNAVSLPPGTQNVACSPSSRGSALVTER